MTIMLKPELSHLISQKDVLFKKDKIIISDFNYYTFLNILRIIDFDNYCRFSKYDQEKTKFAINSIIAENKKLDIFTIINYIKTISEEEFFEIGENYFEMINNYLKGSKFQIEKNKAIIYIDSEMIDLEFILRNFDKVDVLFIYNEKNKSLNIVDRKLNILKKYKNKINESDLISIFQEFNDKQIENQKNDFYNKMLNHLLDSYLNPDTYLADFLDEILNKIANLVLMEDRFEIDERNYRLLVENYRRFEKDEKLCDAITKLMSGRNINKDKYKDLV